MYVGSKKHGDKQNRNGLVGMENKMMVAVLRGLGLVKKVKGLRRTNRQLQKRHRGVTTAQGAESTVQ